MENSLSNIGKENVGLVLSGGGVRGMAQIGAIKALEAFGIEVGSVSGTSAGAVIGALYAQGYSPEEMKRFFKETPLFQINRYAFGKPGFIDTEKFYKDFKAYFPGDRFEDLKKTLYVSAVEMNRGELQVFSRGELIRPLLASSAFPGLFSPMKFNNGLYADGGILNNFPMEPLKDECSFLIGVYVSPLEQLPKHGFRYAFEVLQRAIRINFSNRSKQKFGQCDLLIHPSGMNKYGLLDVNKIDEIFLLGYEAAIKTLEQAQIQKR